MPAAVTFPRTILLLASSIFAVNLIWPTPPAHAQVSAESCDSYRPGLPTKQRMADGNARRLEAAEALLAPGFQPRGAVSGRSLLAEYQEEMERVHPNVGTAALYLASASAVPISLGVVGAVNTTLCVAASPAVARAVAVQAEAARSEMSR